MTCSGSACAPPQSVTCCSACRQRSACSASPASTLHQASSASTCGEGLQVWRNEQSRRRPSMPAVQHNSEGLAAPSAPVRLRLAPPPPPPPARRPPPLHPPPPGPGAAPTAPRRPPTAGGRRRWGSPPGEVGIRSAPGSGSGLRTVQQHPQAVTGCPPCPPQLNNAEAPPTVARRWPCARSRRTSCRRAAVASLGGSRSSPASACACASSPPTSTCRRMGSAGSAAGRQGCRSLQVGRVTAACLLPRHTVQAASTHLLVQAQCHAQAQQRDAHAQLRSVLVQRAAPVALE